jgi:kinesin family protein 18/19
MIDLAGSERASETYNRGIRMIEASHINKSLLALGNCINSLIDTSKKNQFINYRDSKLTRLLKVFVLIIGLVIRNGKNSHDCS